VQKLLNGFSTASKRFLNCLSTAYQQLINSLLLDGCTFNGVSTALHSTATNTPHRFTCDRRIQHPQLDPHSEHASKSFVDHRLGGLAVLDGVWEVLRGAGAVREECMRGVYGRSV
jgi:hypothetical protein